jgi:hypothetical protein
MNSTFSMTCAAAIAVGVMAFALTTGAVPPLEAAVTQLAGRPAVSEGIRTGIPDPDTALLRLIAFTVLAPLALSLGVTAVALVATTVVEPLVRPLRLPEAVLLPLTASMTIATLWGLRDLWLPGFLDLLAVIAQAWLVWSAARPTGLF